MKSFNKYFVYRLKRSALRTFILAILSLAITMTAVPTKISYKLVSNHRAGLDVYALILMVFCLIIPILESAPFKDRRNLDTLYSLPITRWKMALAHYLSGFIQVIVIYSLSFFSAWIYLKTHTDYFSLEYMLPYYLLSLLVGLVIYSLFMFIFGQANTVADGVVFCVLWIYVFLIISTSIIHQIDIHTLYDSEYSDLSYTIENWSRMSDPINNLTDIFEDLIETNRYISYNYYDNYYDYTFRKATEYRETAYMFGIWAFLGISATIGYFISFVKKGAEKAGEISDSWFGYKILIPAYAYSVFSYGNSGGILSVFFSTLMIIGYIVYRRGFKWKISDYIVIGVGVVIFLIS